MSTDARHAVNGEGGNAPPLIRTQPAELELRVVASDLELDGLEQAWSALHRSVGASVFQAWEWQRTWWRHLGRRNPENVLHVIVLATCGGVVGIAPFFVEVVRAVPGAKLRRLAFVGTGLSDHLDVLVAKGLEGRCCERIAAHLAALRGTFDVVSLSDVPDSSPTQTLLHEALGRNGFEGARFVSECCPRTQLKDTWKETLASFEGGHRRQLAKRARQLGERFTVELEICRRPEDVGRDVDAFIEMHQRRWTGVGMKGVYDDARAAAFQREMARLFFDCGWLFLAFLRLDGARVAALCGFEHGGQLAYYLNGVGELGDAARYSPGLVMHSLCMEEMIGRGVRVYDFLRGTERYKYECGAVDVPNWTTLMFRRGARWAKVKNALALLAESLARRIEQERLSFRHRLRMHGLVSRETAGWIARRVSMTVRDGVRKLQSPEQSLTLDAARQTGARTEGGLPPASPG